MPSEEIREEIKHIVAYNEEIKSILSCTANEIKNAGGQIDTLHRLYDGLNQRIYSIELKLGEYAYTRAEITKDMENITDSVEDMEDNIENLDKRLTALEGSASRSEVRWQAITQFIVQLVWIVIAAYTLWKLGLNPPSIS